MALCVRGRLAGAARQSPIQKRTSLTSASVIGRPASRASDTRQRSPVLPALGWASPCPAPATAPCSIDRVRVPGTLPAAGPGYLHLTAGRDVRHRPTVYDPGATAGRCRSVFLTFPRRHAGIPSPRRANSTCTIRVDRIPELHKPFFQLVNFPYPERGRSLG